jgi:hypothetical protein
VIGMVEGYRHGRQRQSVRGVPRAAVLRPLATVVGVPARKIGSGQPQIQSQKALNFKMWGP